MKQKTKKTKMASELLALFAKMTPEERQEAATLGIVGPMAGEGEDPTEAKYGYRCRKCGELALFFLGTMFVDAHGNQTQTPPSNVPCADLPWTQERKAAGGIVRHEPTCQHCGQPVVLNSGKFFQSRRIVDIVLWNKSRAAATPRVKIKGGTQGVDGTWPAPKNIGEMFTPAAKAEMERQAAQHGLDTIEVDTL